MQTSQIFIVEDIISAQLCDRALAIAGDTPFIDGASTAGRWEGQHKHNAQARREPIEPLCEAVLDELLRNRTLCNRTLPHEAVQPMLNRYRAGDFYGPHEDSPIQSGIRADLSYTLFLSEPSAYEGGELVLGDGPTAMRVKPPSRALVCYPSGTLHQVLPVTRGERLALVGWMQSVVRDPARRELLCELRETTDAIAARGDAQPDVASLSRVYGGLLRSWAFA